MRGNIVAKELTPIDVTDTPDLLRLAEEVRRSGQPRLLRRNGEDLAVLSPVAPPGKRRGKRKRTEADREAFLSSAGGWVGLVDVDQFLEDLDESRRLTRPPVEL
jgi:hypothetical protein